MSLNVPSPRKGYLLFSLFHDETSMEVAFFAQVFNNHMEVPNTVMRVINNRMEMPSMVVRVINHHMEVHSTAVMIINHNMEVISLTMTGISSKDNWTDTRMREASTTATTIDIIIKKTKFSAYLSYCIVAFSLQYLERSNAIPKDKVEVLYE